MEKNIKPNKMNKEETIDRPKIEDTLNGMSLSEVHLEYQKSPLLFRHIQLLDKYIDYLESQITKQDETH